MVTNSLSLFARRTLLNRTLGVGTVGLCMLSAGGCNKRQPSPQPRPATAAAAPPIFLAPLTPAERQELYHLPEGGELIPLDVLRAVQSVRTFRPFMEDLGRFRMIEDPDDPDGLPVGISVARVNGQRTLPRQVFLNCSACHSARITYQGRSLQVDGAPAHFDAVAFIVELLQSLDSTLADPQRLAAFLKRLTSLQEAQLPADAAQLKQQADTALESLRLLRAKLAYIQNLRGLRPTTQPGFGRLDAFVAARDLLFGEKHAIDVNSPVSLPPIFGLAKLRWYHYDNNTNSILQRNIGQSLGVGAVADMKSFASTVEVRSLLRLEELVRRIPTPRWPTEILGKLDAVRQSRGAVLYRTHCASCHDYGPDGSFPDQVVDLKTVGTDPNRAVNFARPVGEKPFASALGEVLAEVERRGFEREHVTPQEAAQMEPPQVIWRTNLGYSSRPIDGVWATAPYLHNGSVPTLYDLLLPPAQRPRTFLTGSREYDPKKVGYVTDGAAGATFLFDTAADGNHNTGHTWGTELSDEQRWDLLEYLKGR